MRADDRRKLVQYLDEARSMEQGVTRALQSQIAMTPRGGYRKLLERHLDETRDHARRLHTRMEHLNEGRDLLRFGIGLLRDLLAQALALGAMPLQLARGNGGEEKVLKNAKDTCATEALEIATYTAIEDLANSIGDSATAKLAASIRAEEEEMLDRVLAEIPRLTEAVVRADIHDEPSYEVAKTGAADAVRATGRDLDTAARRMGAEGRRLARQARKVPGVARVEGEVKGALASEEDLPIASYGELTAAEIVDRIPDLSQIDLAKIDAYERKSKSRATVLAKIHSLRAAEPWPGYDELNVEEVLAALEESDEGRVDRVRSYERAHKQRTGVLKAAERELSEA